MQYKNIPKIEVLRMTCQFNMIFQEYLRILGTENTAGGQAPGHEGGGRAHTPWVRPPVSWAHGATPPLIPATTHSIFLPKKSPTSSRMSSSSFCYDFRSPCSKLHSENCLGDCCLVCDSSIGPISFCSSALFIVNPCCLYDPVLELAC